VLLNNIQGGKLGMTTTQKTEVDVAIVGGGAIGATLALELDRLNYRVALVEMRQPDFASSSPERVIALNAGSRMHLERAGVWQDVAAAGTGDIRHIVVAEPGNRGRVDMDAVASKKPLDALGYVIEMGPLLAPIYHKLKESRAHLVCPAAVQAIHIDENGIDLELLSGKQKQTLRASLLIGADGTNSQIRRMVGIQTQGWDYNRFGIVASVRCERSHAETAFECFRASGPLAFLPLADGRYSIVWAVRPGEANQLLNMSDERFIDALQRAAGSELLRQTGGIVETSPRAAFPLELTVARQFAVPRLALVGNAAHTVHPVAGQGMNLGLRDVAVLVQELDSELAHRDPGQSIIMQAYAERRRADTLAVAGFTESMLHTFGSSMPGMKWLRGKGLDVMDAWPGLKEMLLSNASGLSQISDDAGKELEVRA